MTRYNPPKARYCHSQYCDEYLLKGLNINIYGDLNNYDSLTNWQKNTYYPNFISEKFYKGNIEELGPFEVFVFGSNKQGFHGAGAAGFASFGEAGNVWRKYEYDKKSQGWKGKWNVKGIAEGYQEGKDGRSYAIPTVYQAGRKRSLSKSDIIASIKAFYDFVNEPETNSTWYQFKYYVAQEGKMGLNGFSPDEMAEMYTAYPIPERVYFSESFWPYIESRL